jgi:aminoglycoside phosphotransferase (APT) family kinase protein
VERQLGAQVVEAVSQAGGFSPGAAARLRLADGQRVFAKALGPAVNPDSPAIYRREARITAALPPAAPAPRLLWSYDEGEAGWIVLLFADIDGRQPAQPWRHNELGQVLAALADLGAALTPSPLPEAVAGTASEEFASHICGWRRLRDEQPAELAALDPWAAAHLEALIALEQRSPAAVAGNTLLHFDVRADNVLLTDQQVWFVDWPHARIGAAWVDAVLLAPSVTMQGGPPPDEVLARHPAAAGADADAVTAAIVAFAGYLTQRGLQPPPPGLPTLRAFQAAQGIVAREWVARRITNVVQGKQP